jgi:hypothetical protein
MVDFRACYFGLAHDLLQFYTSNDPIKLPIAFAATVIPVAKQTSAATTIPMPIALSRRPVLPSASFRCAIATFWIRKATTLLLAANMTPIPKRAFKRHKIAC